MLQVNVDAVEVVGPERAALAPRLPGRIEHEMVDDELRFSREQVGQGLLAGGPVENVSLLHPLPGQIAPLGAQLIAQPRELLLLDQELFARFDPLRARYDLVRLGHAGFRCGWWRDIAKI